MRKYKIEMSEYAEKDILDIRLYIAKILKEPVFAKNTYEALKNGIFSLSDFPNRYAVVPESPFYEVGVRRMPVHNYVVFYTVDNETATVVVHRVLYMRREWKRIIDI